MGDILNDMLNAECYQRLLIARDTHREGGGMYGDYGAVAEAEEVAICLIAINEEREAIHITNLRAYDNRAT